MGYLEFSVGAALFVAVFWLGSNRTRLLSRDYPATLDKKLIACGLYPSRLQFFYTYYRVAVNSDGMSLTQVVVPYVWRIRTFIPWPDVVAREKDELVLVGGIAVPGVEIPLSKIVLTTMQHRLKGRLPIGHFV